MTEYQKSTDILIERLKQSKKESLEEIKNLKFTPEFQNIKEKLRLLNQV